jgi:hypothetical protein
VAVLAVYGEKLSAFQFPDLRENTGKFWFVGPFLAYAIQVFVGKSTEKGTFPCTFEQEFFRRNREFGGENRD